MAAEMGPYVDRTLVLERLKRMPERPDAVRLQKSIGMFKKTFMANPALTTAVLTGVGRARRPWTAVALMQWLLVDGFVPQVQQWTSAIDVCAKNGEWQQALLLFSQMEEMDGEPNNLTYDAVAHACDKGGVWTQALHILDKSGLDVARCTSGIGACGRASQWPFALQLLGGLGDRANWVHFNAAIGACGTGGEWERALALLDEAPELTTVILNSGLAALAGAGRWQQALQLFEDMPSKRVAADAISMNAAMSSCEKGWQWQRALLLLEDMPRLRLKPDNFGCSAAVTAMGNWQLWERAVLFLREMPSLGVEPMPLLVRKVGLICGEGGKDDLKRSLTNRAGTLRRLEIDAANLMAYQERRQWIQKRQKRKRAKKVPARPPGPLPGAPLPPR